MPERNELTSCGLRSQQKDVPVAGDAARRSGAAGDPTQRATTGGAGRRCSAGSADWGRLTLGRLEDTPTRLTREAGCARLRRAARRCNRNARTMRAGHRRGATSQRGTARLAVRLGATAGGASVAMRRCCPIGTAPDHNHNEQQQDVRPVRADKKNRLIQHRSNLAAVWGTIDGSPLASLQPLCCKHRFAS
ncbi:MAG: hypothetical protein RLZZ450_1756 [Pseudomonadota bacterium]|jgi:hypothetical protein